MESSMRDFHIQKTTAVRQTALLSFADVPSPIAAPNRNADRLGVSVKPPVAKRHRLFYALSGPVQAPSAAAQNCNFTPAVKPTP